MPVPREGAASCAAPEDLAGKESDLQHLLAKCTTVFRDELPSEFRTVREVYHCIETDNVEKPPHRPLYQLSQAELFVVKEYVIDLIREGLIRRCKSPLGASLFFVKGKGTLRAVVDYRGLDGKLSCISSTSSFLLLAIISLRRTEGQLSRFGAARCSHVIKCSTCCRRKRVFN